jgi:hypothetical protein
MGKPITKICKVMEWVLTYESMFQFRSGMRVILGSESWLGAIATVYYKEMDMYRACGFLASAQRDGYTGVCR